MPTYFSPTVSNCKFENNIGVSTRTRKAFSQSSSGFLPTHTPIVSNCKLKIDKERQGNLFSLARSLLGVVFADIYSDGFKL